MHQVLRDFRTGPKHRFGYFSLIATLRRKTVVTPGASHGHASIRPELIGHENKSRGLDAGIRLVA